MIQWGTALHTRGQLGGATACITHLLHIPASTPLLRGVEQGSPGLLLLQGGLTLSS